MEIGKNTINIRVEPNIVLFFANVFKAQNHRSPLAALTLSLGDQSNGEDISS